MQTIQYGSFQQTFTYKPNRSGQTPDPAFIFEMAGMLGLDLLEVKMEDEKLKTKEDVEKFFEGKKGEKSGDSLDKVFAIWEVVEGVYGEKRYCKQSEFDKTRRLLDDLADDGKIGVFRMSNIIGHQYLYGNPKVVEQAEKDLSEEGGEILEEIKKW